MTRKLFCAIFLNVWIIKRAGPCCVWKLAYNTNIYNDANCTHQSSGERLLDSMTENMSAMAAVATIKNKPVSPKKSSHKHLLKETLKARFSQPNIDKDMIHRRANKL